jgi:hypothetical protein
VDVCRAMTETIQPSAADNRRDKAAPPLRLTTVGRMRKEKSELKNLEHCPVCNSELTSGWIGERGWIRWYEMPKGSTAFWCLGRHLLPAASLRWKVDRSKKEAKKCNNCGLVMFSSEKPEQKSLLSRMSPFLLIVAIAILSIVAVLIVTFITLFPPGRPPAPEVVKVMRTVTPSDGYRYLSGYYKVSHNLPTMYAHGGGGKSDNSELLTIVGPETEQTFKMQEIDKAFEEYKGLLKRRGYKP